MSATSSPRPQPQSTKPVTQCPYCEGRDIIKKGARRKKYETVQLYHCRHCDKKFTPVASKYRTYPLKVILEALNAYNRFRTLEAVAKSLRAKYALPITPQSVANWLSDFKEHLSFLKMRPSIANHYNRRDIFIQSRMFHGQIYHFKFHRAKLEQILNGTVWRGAIETYRFNVKDGLELR